LWLDSNEAEFSIVIDSAWIVSNGEAASDSPLGGKAGVVSTKALFPISESWTIQTESRRKGVSRSTLGCGQIDRTKRFG